MIYAMVKGLSLNQSGQLVFIVDRIDSSQNTSGTVRYPISVGDLRHPKIVRIKLQKAIIDEVNTNFNKSYVLKDVFFISFSNDFNLNEWQPKNTYLVEQTTSGGKVSSKTWYSEYNSETFQYSGKICEEIFSWTGMKLNSKQTTYYDFDGSTVLETETEEYSTDNNGQKRIYKRVVS